MVKLWRMLKYSIADCQNHYPGRCHEWPVSPDLDQDILVVYFEFKMLKPGVV